MSETNEHQPSEGKICPFFHKGQDGSTACLLSEQDEPGCWDGNPDYCSAAERICDIVLEVVRKHIKQ